MKEIELKFQVPDDQRTAIDVAVSGPRALHRVRLQAVYFDTLSGALAGAALALRLRKEGRRWVQTLKGGLPDATGMTRAEHNVDVAASGASVPPVDPSRHAGTAVGDRLQAALNASGEGLQRVMATDIWRRARTVRQPGGSVELAYDSGAIEAGPPESPRRMGVCELEIELKSGTPHVLLATARRWVARHGLWLDTRSKAELGNLLVREATMAAARHSRAVVLERGMTPASALDAVLASCLEQISVNASQVASGVHSVEHVHQLRVGLRRLRTALRFFDGDELAEAIEAPKREVLASAAAALFRQLGAARDQAAVADPLQIELTRALAAVGLSGEAPRLPPPPTADDPAALVRQPDAQRLLLDLIARTEGVGTLERVTAGDPPDRPAPATLRERVAWRLDHWHRQVRRDAKRFDALDDAGRHQLRKRIKRLRYASEFARELFDDAKVRAYLKALRALQERLGAVNDVAVGIALYSVTAPSDARALFALGWLASQRERSLAACRPELERFIELRCFWRKAADRSARGARAGG
jgi:inorganic triphosphatase YgiF